MCRFGTSVVLENSLFLGFRIMLGFKVLPRLIDINLGSIKTYL